MEERAAPAWENCSSLHPWGSAPTQADLLFSSICLIVNEALEGTQSCPPCPDHLYILRKGFPVLTQRKASVTAS